MAWPSTTYHYWWETGLGQPAPPPGIPGFDILWPDGGPGLASIGRLSSIRLIGQDCNQ